MKKILLFLENYFLANGFLVFTINYNKQLLKNSYHANACYR